MELIRRKKKKDGCIGSFNYGELNKEYEKRSTEGNHIINYAKKDTSGSDKSSINT